MGKDLVEQNAPNGRVNQLSIPPDLDPGMESHLLRIVGRADLFHRPKHLPFAFLVGPGLGDVVEAEHDILGRRGQRGSVGRRQDIVRRPQEDPCLQLCLE